MYAFRTLKGFCCCLLAFFIMIASCYDSALDRPRKERLYKERKFRGTGGFLNHAWGTSRVALDEYFSFGDYKLGSLGTIEYRVHLDTLYGVRIDSIYFEFYDDGFVGVTVFIDNQNHPKMLDSLAKQLGEFKISLIEDPMIFYTFDRKWDKKTTWGYKYDMKDQYGILSISSHGFFVAWLVSQGPAYVDSVLELLRTKYSEDSVNKSR